MAEKGQWVRIKRLVLESGQRADKLPEETGRVPFTVWVTGRLVSGAALGEEATVMTKTGRLEQGELLEVEPVYRLDYGRYVPQIAGIGEQAWAILAAGNGEASHES
ncbi:MAG: 2-amino-4-oxopentanoate thiolase subunit OrtA [Treponema sp.]|nr:2-amino-4-oxopentanoate thiolase subunit OrtA [Treponema sp.]